MGPKRNRKGVSTSRTVESADTEPLLPPQCSTWPGWVEMESEPAFFNVMLREMGVRGVKVQEVYGLDEQMIAILPQPVHALIFLFRYREVDNEQREIGRCPKHVWFANQTPDFACATFALLNIVNNVPGLELGKELSNFREFTEDMDPLSRGDAIDTFDFVKSIHNSFARDVDMLNADMELQGKMGKLKKRQALAKAKQTREARENGSMDAPSLKERSINVAATPTRASPRSKKSSGKITESKALAGNPDGDFQTQGDRKSLHAEALIPSSKSRRSSRTQKPRQTPLASAAADAEDEEGFHFAAYMPIQGHVWKLDGLDSFPQDLGSFGGDSRDDWMHVAQPALMGRMAQYEASEIQFNLMAIVHDPYEVNRKSLVENVKLLQSVEKKLSNGYEDWRAMECAETTKDVIAEVSPEFCITAADLVDIEVKPCIQGKIDQEASLLKLIDLRKELIKQQAGLRTTVRDELVSIKADNEKARHRRHDYGTFVRTWLGALAEQEVLAGLLDG